MTYTGIIVYHPAFQIKGPLAWLITLVSETIHFFFRIEVHFCISTYVDYKKESIMTEESCIKSRYYNSNQFAVYIMIHLIKTIYHFYPLLLSCTSSPFPVSFSKVILIHRNHLYHLLFILNQFYIKLFDITNIFNQHITKYSLRINYPIPLQHISQTLTVIRFSQH